MRTQKQIYATINEQIQTVNETFSRANISLEDFKHTLNVQQQTHENSISTGINDTKIALNQLKEHLPDAHAAFAPFAEAIGTPEERDVLLQSFQNCPRISIDYGVMERATKVFVVPGSFGWSDVGDWRAVYGLSDKNDQGNAVNGNVILHDSSRCFVNGNNRLVVLVGIHDAVVVDTEDAVLVCKTDSAQQVKNVVDYLHAHQLTSYV